MTNSQLSSNNGHHTRGSSLVPVGEVTADKRPRRPVTRRIDTATATTRRRRGRTHCELPPRRPGAQVTVIGDLLGNGSVWIDDEAGVVRVELKAVLFAVAMLLANAARRRKKSAATRASARPAAGRHVVLPPQGFVSRAVLESQLKKLDPSWAKTNVNKAIHKLRQEIAAEATLCLGVNGQKYAAEIIETAWPGRRWSAGAVTLTLLDGARLPASFEGTA
jgi:hypothetical protein